MRSDEIAAKKNSQENESPTENEINKLSKQLAWYKSFFEKATDAVFIVQPETWTILDANDYSSSLLGMPKEELIGSNLPQFRRIFKLLKKSSSPTVLSELSLETATRSLMVEVSARFMEYEGQVMILAIARDVSEQHALTDKMVQADKLVLLGQLSAGVSHEIRNPLAAVNLNLQILKRDLDETSHLYNYVRTALQGVERISRIVDLTLNFSRPTMPEIKSLNMNSILTTSLDLVSHLIKRKDIKVELNIEHGLPLVHVDAKQIQQVFINLITNAADAIESTGKIKIESYTEEGGRQNEGTYAVCSIEDTGAGISPEDLPKIFNPFFTRKADGTGLGLPITQRILHQHNGIIDVESKLGSGTTFYVKLPVLNS